MIFAKYTFIAFLVVFEVGSVICGAAQSSNMLIAGRTIAGLGGSGLRNGALTIMSESIPLKERPRKLLLSISSTRVWSWHEVAYFGVCMGSKLILTPDLTLKYLLCSQELVAMLGAVAGPLIGGAFTVSVSWRWCKSISSPVTLLSSHGFYRFLHQPTHRQPSFY